MASPLKHSNLSRRQLFASTGAAALGLAAPAAARVAPDNGTSEFSYEVTRSDDEWRAMLNDDEFAILREGYTEKPKSSPLWEETRPGSYHCKGCDLHSFSAHWKTVLSKGWVFFFHPEPNSVLTNIDGPTPDYGSMTEGKKALTEIHCRRCGSHLGHFLIVEGKQTHCINGASLVFKPQAS
jgi:peptide-methionine (R)-S-oxide reductase